MELIGKVYKVMPVETGEGKNGTWKKQQVIIEVKDNRIRVKKETSPLHICSKQGYSKSVPIICLPNKIIIKLGEN